MSKRDYYEILGVERDDDLGTIKKAYRRLAMKFHPDRNPGDAESEERFKEASEAYEVLADAQRREIYDRYGHEGLKSGGGAGGAGFGGFGDIFGDIFSDIFNGGGGRRGGPRRGSDLRYNLSIRLEDAVKGTEVQIRIPQRVNCESCSGSGARKGTQPTTCPTCRGAGQVRINQGFLAVSQTCPQCRGRGQVVSDPCGDCGGSGQQQRERTLKVTIPPGVDTGDRIRLGGEGEAGSSGAMAGDLYVQIEVEPHHFFERQDNNLYCQIPLDMVTAALGGEIEVPTLNGRATLKIPAETQNGGMLRIRGEGVKPVRGGPQGDLLCQILVETPVNLNRKQRELLRAFGDALGGSDNPHNPRSRSWFDKAREFFEEHMK